MVGKNKIEFQTIVHVLVIVLVVAIVLLAIRGSVSKGSVEQMELFENIMPECYILKNTGHECPSCGLTKGFYAFFDGNMKQAVDYNMMVFPVIVVLLLLMVNSIYYLIYKKYNKWVTGILLVSTGMVVIGYIIRLIDLIKALIA